MDVHPLLTALLVVLSATSLLALDECQPNCYGHVDGDKVQDPFNCTQFYVCVYEGRPSDHAVACPINNVFDPQVGACIPGNNCVASCVPTCHMTCNGNMDIIQDPKDCNVYYICDTNLNVVGPYYCPPDRPYFDGEKCIDDYIRCCMTPCIPYCYSANGVTPDPYDCTKYYICLEEGPADQALHYTCPNGMTFQYSSGKCTEGAPCVTLCGYTSSTTTTTTTTTGYITIPHRHFPHPSGHELQPSVSHLSAGGYTAMGTRTKRRTMPLF